MNGYSVIIPAYNAARTIEAALASVQAQTIPPEAVLVVDDGSRDETAAIVATMPGVSLIRQANAGPGAARNRGAALADSEWLAFLDADDTWLPHKLECQLQLAKDQRVGVIHASGPDHVRPAPPRVGFADLWALNWITLSSAIVRKAAFAEVGGFDEDRALISVEDYNLWLRIAATGWEIATWPETLIQYSPAPASLSNQTRRFAEAHLQNARALGVALDLDPDQVDALIQRYRIAFGKDFFWRREMTEARRLLGAALRSRPGPDLLFQFLATFCPRAVLDWRRRLATQREPSRPGPPASPST